MQSRALVSKCRMCCKPCRRRLNTAPALLLFCTVPGLPGDLAGAITPGLLRRAANRHDPGGQVAPRPDRTRPDGAGLENDGITCELLVKQVLVSLDEAGILALVVSFYGRTTVGDNGFSMFTVSNHCILGPGQNVSHGRCVPPNTWLVTPSSFRFPIGFHHVPFCGSNTVYT